MSGRYVSRGFCPVTVVVLSLRLIACNSMPRIECSSSSSFEELLAKPCSCLKQHKFQSRLSYMIFFTSGNSDTHRTIFRSYNLMS